MGDTEESINAALDVLLRGTEYERPKPRTEAGVLKDGTVMEFHAVLPDGRVVYEVPKERWLLKNWPELEVECVICHHGIRFHQYTDESSYIERPFPDAHNGACIAKLSGSGSLVRARGRKEHNTNDDLEKLMEDIV